MMHPPFIILIVTLFGLMSYKYLEFPLGKGFRNLLLKSKLKINLAEITIKNSEH